MSSDCPRRTAFVLKRSNLTFLIIPNSEEFRSFKEIRNSQNEGSKYCVKMLIEKKQHVFSYSGTYEQLALL
jgi:hypothetical protein